MILLKIEETFLIDRLTLPFLQANYSWTSCVIPPTQPDCHNLNSATTGFFYRNFLALYYKGYWLYRTLPEFLKFGVIKQLFEK